MSKAKTGALVVGACAAACAGAAVLPALLGGVAAGGALAALEGEATLVLLLVILGGGAYLWQREARSSKSCGCAGEQGCRAGGATCTLPEVKEQE